MNVRLLLVLFVLLLGPVCSGPLAAQTPGAGPLAACGDTDVATKGALTIYPDVVVYAAPFGEATVAGPRIPFRTRVRVLPTRLAGDRVLVRAETSERQCGYVQDTKILMQRGPLTVFELFPEEQITGDRRKGTIRNTWYIRAMLRSDPAKDEDAGQAQVFDAPNGTATRSSRVFGLFNVFKVEKLDGSTDPDDWWYFIGGGGVMNNKALSGWVRGSNLFLWRSGISVYSASDKAAPFDVYSDVKSLRAASKEGLLGQRWELDPPSDSDIPKFPVLDQIFRDRVADQAARRPPVAYEIGFFAQGCGPDGCLSASAIKKAIGDLGKGVQKAKNVDVMFVIDNTESMGRYFAPIARAVGEWSRRVSRKRPEGGRGGQIRFGAAIYGDYHDTVRPSIDLMDYSLIAQFSTQTTLFEQELARPRKEYGDAFKDQPEAQGNRI